MKRPDLTNVDPKILAYIEFLEKAAFRKPLDIKKNDAMPLVNDQSSEPLPAEHESKAWIITISQQGSAKRTYRHLYTRQHRGGMGVFGIEIDKPDQAGILTSIEDYQNLLFFTNYARVFRQPVDIIKTTGVFSAGNMIMDRFPLEKDESFVAVLPEQAKGYIAIVSEKGRLRCLRHHLFGEHMRQGVSFLNPVDHGKLADACWTQGDADILLVTHQGIGIRFSEKLISPQGEQAIRLVDGDKVVGITPVYPESNVFIVGADGRGVIRMMSGFSANKSPGGSGKIAIKNNKVVSLTTVGLNDDLFILSRLGKIIRFPTSEVPPTEGVVQGVNCMSLRGDEVVNMINSGPIY